MSLANLIARRAGGGVVILAPAAGATQLTGTANPYAAVEIYKNTGTNTIGVAFANAQGAWTMTLATPAAQGDIYRPSSGGGQVVGAPVVVANLGPATAGFTVGVPENTIIAAITGLSSGETIASFAPNDGRIKLNANANTFLVGPSASAAGNIALSLLTSNGRSLAINVTATAAVAAIVLGGVPAAATAGTAYTFTPTVTNGTAPFTFDFTDVALPTAWSQSSSSGAIGGVTAQTGNFSVTVLVTDKNGLTATKAYAFNVAAAGGAANLARATTNYPIVGEGPGSRERQNGQGVSPGNVRTYVHGQTTWARALDRRVRQPFWYQATAAGVTPPSLSGFIMGSDGEGFTQCLARIPAILASDINWYILGLSSNSMQLVNPDGTPFTVTGYCDQAKDIVTRIRAGGVGVIVKELWERGGSPSPTGPGGFWQTPRSAGSPPMLIPAINAEMKTWCAAQNPPVPFMEVRAAFVDTTTANACVPFTDLVRPDETHLSAKGGVVMGKIERALFATLFAAPTALDATAAGNFFTNPTLTGTGGTLGSGTAGVFADGITAARQAATGATVTGAKVTASGKSQQQVSIDTSGMAASTVDGATFALTAPTGLSSGKWYIARMRVELDAWDGWLGVPYLTAKSGSVQSDGMLPIDTGGSGVYAPNANILPGPTTAETYVIETQPMLLASTTCTLTAGVYWKPSAGGMVGRFRITDIEYREFSMNGVNDPRLLMYDEADITPLSVTSPTTYSFPEESIGSFNVVTSRLCKFSITGADAAKFTVDAFGKVSPLNAPNFEDPGSAALSNTYSFNVVSTPFNPNVAAVTQAITYVVTDIDDGITFAFTGTDGTDIADLYSGVITRVGPTGSIVVGANAALNVIQARAAYFPPQQGNTRYQQIRYKVSGPSASIREALLLIDQDNGFYLGFGSGVPKVTKMVGGVETSLFTPVAYKTVSNGDEFIANLYQAGAADMVQILQNGVEIGLFDVSATTQAAPFSTVVRSGLLSNNNAGSGNKIDNANFRVSTGKLPSKTGLKALTLTPLTGALGSNYVGLIANRTTNSTITVSSVTFTPPSGTATVLSDGSWYGDGDNIRGSSPAAGTYVVVVQENYGGAVNDGRTTSFTIVIS